jgi:hypothetical protein
VPALELSSQHRLLVTKFPQSSKRLRRGRQEPADECTLQQILSRSVAELLRQASALFRKPSDFLRAHPFECLLLVALGSQPRGQHLLGLQKMTHLAHKFFEVLHTSLVAADVVRQEIALS